MSPQQRHTAGTDPDAALPEAGPQPADGERKQIYLRTVYALNPGIPHSVDLPGVWD